MATTSIIAAVRLSNLEMTAAMIEVVAMRSVWGGRGELAQPRCCSQ